MHNKENEVRQKLRLWKIDPVDDAMLDRIVRKSVAKSQMLPLGYKLKQWLAQSLSEWHAGLAYKLASLLLCAVVGFGIGIKDSSPAVDLTIVAFDSGQAGEFL